MKKAYEWLFLSVVAATEYRNRLYLFQFLVDAQPWLCQKYGTSIKIKSVDDDQEIEYFTSFELEQSGRKKKRSCFNQFQVVSVKMFLFKKINIFLKTKYSLQLFSIRTEA